LQLPTADFQRPGTSDPLLGTGRRNSTHCTTFYSPAGCGLQIGIAKLHLCVFLSFRFRKLSADALADAGSQSLTAHFDKVPPLSTDCVLLIARNFALIHYKPE
jgi:hypothetical protein